MDKAKPKSIKFFMDTGRWGFLSPMYLCNIRIDGITYKSAEHYYQSMKAKDEEKRKWIADAATGYDAKERARTLKPDEKIQKSPDQKVETIRRAFIAKFTQIPDLKSKLLETGDSILLEDSPDDLFWGAKGENWIGKSIMEVRELLRQNSRK